MPSNAILVTVDVVGLYPSISHEAGLKALYEKLEGREGRKIPLSDLVNMSEFVLKNNHFEFDSKVKTQISGTAIGTKFTPLYMCVFMDKVEREFLEAENIKSLVWLRHMNIFFIWAESKNKLEGFLQCLNTFYLNPKFMHKKSKIVNFLDVVIRVNSDKFDTDIHSKPTDCHQLNFTHTIHIKKSIAYSQGLHNKVLLKRLIKLNTIFTVIVSVLFTFYIIRCLIYSMLGQLC